MEPLILGSLPNLLICGFSLCTLNSFTKMSGLEADLFAPEDFDLSTMTIKSSFGDTQAIEVGLEDATTSMKVVVGTKPKLCSKVEDFQNFASER